MDWEEIRDYVGFTVQDERTLRAFHPAADPHLQGIVDEFYAAVLAHASTRRVLADQQMVLRLNKSLRRWVDELLLGPWDDGYYQRRETVGRRHVEVGLPPQFVITAMILVEQGLTRIAREVGADVEGVGEAVRRACAVDSAVMTGTYVVDKEARQLKTLQDLIVGHLPVTLLLLDEHGVVSSATHPGARLFGGVAPVGLSYTQVIPPSLVAEAQLGEVIGRARRTGREITLLRVDADIEERARSFRITVVPLEHPLAKAMVHLEELTDTVATEARLRDSLALAQLGALSAAVAHELRNPLAGISGAIQVIAGSLPAEDRRKPIMAKVEGQIQRLNALVTDLLAFARPVKPQQGALDLRAVAEGVRDVLAQEGLAVEIEGHGSARGDERLAHQIVLNLVRNAGQSGAGRRVIAIEPGQIEVHDDGPGIPPEVAERLFTPFFTTKTQGTGLGLAVSRNHARAMEGDLEQAPSRLGGASFRLKLPS